MAYPELGPFGPLRVVTSLALCLGALAGCGSSDGEAPSSTPTDSSDLEPPTLEAPAEGEFAIATSGELAVEGGTATLKFVETSTKASLEIMGTSESGSMLLLRLSFPRDGEVFGEHQTTLALPNESDNVAHVLFSGEADFKYSRSGAVELTLSREDHRLSGTFNVDLSAANDLGDGVFEPVGEVSPLIGTFIGTYQAECYATIPGHSMATRPDSEFCQSLGL